MTTLEIISYRHILQICLRVIVQEDQVMMVHNRKHFQGNYKKLGWDHLWTLDMFFSSNHNIHKSSCGLCFWALDPLIDRFYYNLSIIGSEAQKQMPDKLLWMLWFDEKSIFKIHNCNEQDWTIKEKE